MNVPKIVSEYIQEFNLLSPQETVLVAVSGGADSLCLLLVLKELGFSIRAAHFDHGLRLESAQDSESVRRIADRLGIPFHGERGDVRQQAKRNHETLEEAAREMRYDFLARTAEACGAPAIATGHTADDQAETVLLRLLRGTGFQGLGGIRPDSRFRGARIIRPLLGLTHAQTVEYCRTAGWEPLEDSTNRDPSFARNRIRAELIPGLREYNPQIVPVLCRLADIAAAQTELLERATDDVWKLTVRLPEPGVILMPRDVFNQTPTALRQTIVRRAVKEISGSLRDLAYRHVKSVIDFSLVPTSTRKKSVALGIEVSVESSMLVFRKREKFPVPPEWEQILLSIPGGADIRQPDWKIRITQNAADGMSPADAGKDPWTVHLDADKIHPPLFLRRRAAGDRFLPAGMPGAVKLNDFLASHHLPFAERDRWPLVCDGEGILWIPGFRVRAGAAISCVSAHCVEIRVERLAG